MTAAGILAWALAVHGATQIATVSRIARPLRDELADLASAARLEARSRLGRAWARALGVVAQVAHCPMCCGFWVGALLSIAGLDPLGLEGRSWLLRTVLDGAAGSAVAWAAHVYLAHLGARDL